MSELSRRDFLKVSGSALVGGVLPLDVFHTLSPENKDPLLEWREIGPHLGNQDGIRALFVSPHNQNTIVAGTWEKGALQTNDGGSTWNQRLLPHPKDIDPYINIVRDMIPLKDDLVLVLSDYSISVIKLSDPHFNQDVSIEEDKMTSGPQTACVVGDEVIIAGFSGVYKTKINKLITHDPTTGVYDWGQPIPVGSLKTHMIRSVAYDKEHHVIYAGGWLSPKDLQTGNLWPGTGLYVSNDGGESFTKHPLHDQMLDPNGPMSINTIVTLNLRGHDIVLIGGEGNGGGQTYSPEELPFFRIIVDGKLYDTNLCNNSGLKKAGGYGLVAPQKGIVASVASFNLDQLIKGEKLLYETVARHDFGEIYFGAGHLCLTHQADGRYQLATGGRLWTTGNPVQVRVSEIDNPKKALAKTK